MEKTIDIRIQTKDQLIDLLGAIEYVTSERVKAIKDLIIESKMILKGSMLIAIDGISIQTLVADDIKQLLQPASCVPLQLSWFQSVWKKGKLTGLFGRNIRSFEGLRGREWMDLVVEIDRDMVTFMEQNITTSTANSKRLLVLTKLCRVKRVHEYVTGRCYCFLISDISISMLLQAKSEQEMEEWIDSIQQALNLAQGWLPGDEKEEEMIHEIGGKQVQKDEHEEKGMIHNLEEDDDEEEWEPHSSELQETIPSSSREHVVHPTYTPIWSLNNKEESMPVQDIPDLLVFLQRSGRIIEALQLLVKYSSLRNVYWKKIFEWAISPVATNEYELLLNKPVGEEYVACLAC